MGKTKNDRGRDAFRRRQRKQQQRAERNLAYQQRNIRLGSFAIVAIAIVIALVNGITANTKSVTDPASWRLPKLSGKGTISLSHFAGKPTVVTFYSSWCQDCRDELSGFVAQANIEKGKVNFVAIDTRETSVSNAKKMAADVGFASWPTARDVGGKKKGGLHDQFSGQGPATTVFYDATGKQVDVQAQAIDSGTLQERLATLFQVTS